ncbi:hypothetical protein [Butyrivibrio fibrisolvens]|uniref:hypothetical protein n=1 Tax=Butyrivibrio fibrisolvens TaxID=831 RepID=UPI00048062A3|nr:hypothetical protein [Butyrivibrio fibrisolvens]
MKILDYVDNWFNTIIKFIFLAVFYIVFMVVFSSFQIPYIAVAFPVLVVVGIALATRSKNRKMPFVVIVLCLPLLIVIAERLQVSTNTWDYGRLLGSAAEYVLTGNIADTNYYAVYPNNKMWLTVLVLYFKIIKIIVPCADSYFLFKASTFFSAVMIWCVIALFYRIVDGSLYKCICLIICLPLWCYSTFAYTDVAIMLLIACLIYIIKVRKNNQSFLLYVVLGVMLSYGYLVKPTFFIAYIAIIMIIVVRIIQQKLYKQVSAFIVSMCVSTIILTSICNMIVPISEEDAQRWQMPATHYFMMGMNSADNGGYVQDDVMYTKSFETPEEKKAANISMLKERVSEMGIGGTIKFITINKTYRTWGNSSLNAPMYLVREPLNESILHEFVLENGKYYKLFNLYCWIYHLFMLAGLFLSGLFAIKNNSEDLIIRISRLTILGLFAFLSIWECNSRYLVAFLPMIVLVSTDGWSSVTAFIRRIWENESKVIINR